MIRHNPRHQIAMGNRAMEKMMSKLMTSKHRSINLADDRGGRKYMQPR